jgi:uncharacterized membrane protein
MGQEQNPPIERYAEIDALRGLAILFMAGFHLSWDLVFFGMSRTNMSSGPWPWFSRIIATMFLTLAGISLTLSYSRAGPRRAFAKYGLRGLKVFGLGMAVTLVTYLTIGRQFVVFGILHLIGFSIAAAYPFLPRSRRYLTLIAGVLLFALGAYLNRQHVTTPWLLWLGVPQLGRGMLDYYPVLPWFGMVLFGIWLGHTLYPNGQPRFLLPDLTHVPVLRELCFLGRHSLLIYVVHQPILLGILYAIDALL